MANIPHSAIYTGKATLEQMQTHIVKIRSEHPALVNLIQGVKDGDENSIRAAAKALGLKLKDQAK